MGFEWKGGQGADCSQLWKEAVGWMKVLRKGNITSVSVFIIIIDEQGVVFRGCRFVEEVLVFEFF